MFFLNLIFKKYNLNKNLKIQIFFKVFIYQNLKKKIFIRNKRNYFVIENQKFFINRNDKKGLFLSEIGSLQNSKIKFITKVIDKYITSKSIYIDIGTNYGEFCSIIKNSNIEYSYLFEPNKKVAKYLEKSLKINSYSNYKLEKKCLSLSNAKYNNFYIDINSSGSSSLIKKKDNYEKIKVDNLHIKSFLKYLITKENNEFVFKIDIEGVDFEIVKEIIFFFNKKKYYYFIIFEFSSTKLNSLLRFINSNEEILTFYCVHPIIQNLKNKNMKNELNKINIYEKKFAYDLFLSNKAISI